MGRPAHAGTRSPVRPRTGTPNGAGRPFRTPGHIRFARLRPVRFIDRTGLGVLCRARNRAEARRGRLRLRSESEAFLRLLRATGLRDSFEVETGRAEAVPG
ncbi:STAS domain-containing protein [Streptomyces sp. NBC_00566]|uniref:STAS domain-containing protein n=1 Tax=Streptomyces sp. NBC_00566 TaxID=2975778 RepID=UPI002E820786|nr:STAS domain-containing protein [Streptomyces sp. NBC_00566]WUB85814.1 STAS domain-containing protein [Streptomyces sp. NBC_00566]